MPSQDIHKKKFDDATLTKLEIFRAYTSAWLPTFIMQGRKKILIVDFFAGPGYDSEGIEGSPILVLKEINKFTEHIFKKNVKICLVLNEFSKRKYHRLKESIDAYINKHEHFKRFLNIEITNDDFDDSFQKQIKEIEKYPSLVLLDQNGMKFIRKKYIQSLENTRQTDFLYFLSSSFVSRFGDTDEFQKHLTVDVNRLRDEPYRYVHNILIDEIRKLLPAQTKTKLYPFSLKKGSNIYGLIFGASNPIAVEKFLRVVWSINPANGQANYDIDDESSISPQLNIFSPQRLSKIQQFKKDFKNEVLDMCPTTNKELYLHCLDRGHLPTHGAEVLKEMKKSKLIDYEGRSPKITKDSLRSSIVHIKKTNN